MVVDTQNAAAHLHLECKFIAFAPEQLLLNGELKLSGVKQKENIQHRLWVFNIGKVQEIFDVVTYFLLSHFWLGIHF